MFHQLKSADLPALPHSFFQQKSLPESELTYG